MKNTLQMLALATTFLFLLSCTRDSRTADVLPVPVQQTVSAHTAPNSARVTGLNYSRSIPVDTANRMLNSYLGSVGYPSVDTAVRDMFFDADTLRAYLLQNPNIVTVKFMIAHQQTYINAGHGGENAGMSPDALTLVIVGMDNNDHYVLNSQNGVYDHLYNCPHTCPTNSSAFIQ